MNQKSKNDLSSKNTLKRSDVARNIHHEMGLSSTDSAELVKRVFHHISEALISGEDVKLAGFGTFKLRQKAARLGRNPKTGEECLVTSRKVVTFKPSVFMKERVEGALKPDHIVGENDMSAKALTLSNNAGTQSREEGPTPNQGFPSLRRKEWIALFELLGSFAFVDSAFQKSKTETFIQSVLEIKTILDPSAPVTRKSISSWVKLNRKRFSGWDANETLIPKFKMNLSALKSFSHKQDIIFAMVDIAIAEDDFCDLDKALIARAILDWDMPTNIVSDLKYVCPEMVSNL